jgi:hypothetical protein
MDSDKGVWMALSSVCDRLPRVESMIPRQAKRDASEKSIVQTLESLGYSVLRLSVPHGPDLLAAKRGGKPELLLAECKTGKGKLRPGQQKFADRWPCKVFVFRTPEDVLEALT